LAREDKIDIIIHGVNAKNEYLSKIKSLNDEITLLKHEKWHLQDECAHYYL